MKALTLLFVVVVFSMGHSYAGEVEGNQARPPHEAIVITEYGQIMNGKAPIDLTLPTDIYGELTNNARILDSERVPGKIVGRSPAVVDDMTVEKYLDQVEVKQK